MALDSSGLFASVFSSFSMRNNNTSLPGIELAGPTMDMVNFYWESMQQLYTEHHIFLEILFTTSWWLRYLVPSWRRASNRKIVKHMKYPFIPLLAHLTCGTLAMIRYYYLYLALGDSPVPTLLDLVLSLGFTATGVQLSGYVREGNVPVLKAAFKAMAFQQAIATFAGYTYGSAQWHRAGIKVMNAFVWVRWFNEYGTVFQGFRTYGARFTASTVISHPLCMWEGDYPAGMPVYVALLFAFLAVDKWAARKLDGKPGPIPRALAHCGFVTVEKKHRDVEKLGITESEEKTGAKLE